MTAEQSNSILVSNGSGFREESEEQSFEPDLMTTSSSSSSPSSSSSSSFSNRRHEGRIIGVGPSGGRQTISPSLPVVEELDEQQPSQKEKAMSRERERDRLIKSDHLETANKISLLKLKYKHESLKILEAQLELAEQRDKRLLAVAQMKKLEKQRLRLEEQQKIRHTRQRQALQMAVALLHIAMPLFVALFSTPHSNSVSSFSNSVSSFSNSVSSVSRARLQCLVPGFRGSLLGFVFSLPSSVCFQAPNFWVFASLCWMVFLILHWQRSPVLWQLLFLLLGIWATCPLLPSLLSFSLLQLVHQGLLFYGFEPFLCSRLKTPTACVLYAVFASFSAVFLQPAIASLLSPLIPSLGSFFPSFQWVASN